MSDAAALEEILSSCGDLLTADQEDALTAAIAMMKRAENASADANAVGSTSELITPAELWRAVDGNPGITPTKEQALEAARLCAEAADADEDQGGNDVATFTVWCRESNGRGTIYITSVVAESAVAAGREARLECAGNWNAPDAVIDVIGIADGDVNILHWDDEPGGGGVDLTVE